MSTSEDATQVMDSSAFHDAFDVGLTPLDEALDVTIAWFREWLAGRECLEQTCGNHRKIIIAPRDLSGEREYVIYTMPCRPTGPLERRYHGHRLPGFMYFSSWRAR
ncbi:MAG: hypothetical protein ACR2HO_10515 [Rubrobacteraceae bacterium]|nr:hypothetical protein [Rubrobacter sp.]